MSVLFAPEGTMNNGLGCKGLGLVDEKAESVLITNPQKNAFIVKLVDIISPLSRMSGIASDL